MRFSLLAYGAHPHDLRLDDDPVTVLAWAEPAQAVLAHLPVLRRARARPAGPLHTGGEHRVHAGRDRPPAAGAAAKGG